jgi:tryptophan 2,3-dioxygenase
VYELSSWVSSGADPSTFPYSHVVAEYRRVGKHFVDKKLLVTLDNIRADLPLTHRHPSVLRQLRQFLDIALDKWDGRYDYRTYLGLSLLRMPQDASPGDRPATARRQRDRLFVQLLADALSFELAVIDGPTGFLPQQIPDEARVVKRCRLGIRAALPALARLGLAGAVDADEPLTAARRLHAVVAAETSEQERLELRLTMLPVYLVHDEYLFIRVLQSYECTFALLTVELRSAITALATGAAREAADRLAFAEDLLNGAAPLFSLLATMQPESFRTFRVYTEGASAIQSRSYKLLESLCRTPDESRLESPAYLSVPEIRERVRNGQSSLDETYRFAGRAGLLDPADQPILDQRMRAFAAALTQWRQTHYRLATRMLGVRPGTGYTQGTPYLDAVRSIPVFTVLSQAQGP